MKSIKRVLAIPVLAALLVCGFPGSAAAAPAPTRTVNFDSNLPDGSTYSLTIGSTTYDITAIAGPDKTIQVADAAVVNFTYSQWAQVSAIEMREYYWFTSTASPITVTSDTNVIGSYDFIYHRLTFDQEGLAPGTGYYIDWDYASAIHDLIAGTPLIEWQPNSLIYVIYQNPVFTATGPVNLGGIDSTVTPSGTYPGGGFTYTVSGGPIDFVGRYITGGIDGTVFWDYNNNGIQDPGEPGIAGATVELLGTLVSADFAGQLAPPGTITTLLSTQTDGNGFYAFDGVAAGTFFVRVTLPDGSQQESGAITLEETGGSMNSVQADFPELTTLPFTGE